MKDAKGHGSDKRGGGFNRHGQRMLPSVAQVPLGKLRGEEGVQATFERVGRAGIKVIGGEGKVARIAQRHGIQGGPFKVQTLNTRLAGVPFETKKSYRNRTVAEHVAKYMRTDGDHVRIKVR